MGGLHQRVFVDKRMKEKVTCLSLGALQRMDREPDESHVARIFSSRKSITAMFSLSHKCTLPLGGLKGRYFS